MGLDDTKKMKKIRTICGDIAPDQLGYTAVHEHTIFNETKMKIGLMKSIPSMVTGAGAYEGGADIGREGESRKELGVQLPERDLSGVFSSFGNPKGNKLSQKDYYVGELKAFRQAGGQTLCDCSGIMKPPTKTVRYLSETSGVKIITCVGFYTEAFIPKKLWKKGEAAMGDDLSRRLEAETDQGRSGFFKCAISVLSKNGEISQAERMAVRVCAVRAKETGMCLHIHTAFPLRKMHVLQIADMLEKEIGLLPERVVFCHMDSFGLGNGNMSAHINLAGYDVSLAAELAKRGFHIGLDTWEYAPDFDNPGFGVAARTEFLLDLISRGYVKNITLGHDCISRKAGVQNGSFGYTFLPRYLQFLKEKGRITEADIYQMTVATPAEIFAF